MFSRTFWTRLETQEFIHTFIHEYKQTEFYSSRGGGGGALPQGPIPYHFISTIFDRKSTLFRDK